MSGLNVGGTLDPRPHTCCGVCPPIVGGGYDCTCIDNPACPKYRVSDVWGESCFRADLGSTVDFHEDCDIRGCGCDCHREDPR